MPSIHQGIFNENNIDIYPTKIAFAIIDVCIYDSLLSIFNIIWDKLELNGIIIINKYDNDYFFGIKHAIQEIFYTLDNCKYIDYTYNILYNNYNILVISKIDNNNKENIIYNNSSIKII